MYFIGNTRRFSAVFERNPGIDASKFACEYIRYLFGQKANSSFLLSIWKSGVKLAMLHVDCVKCGTRTPRGESFEIAGRTLCFACANQFAQENPTLESEQIHRMTDPTICVNCGADGGEKEHSHLAKLPTCDKCEVFFRNRPFPTWLKGAMAVVALAVVVAFARNWRFFQAIHENKSGFVELAQGRDEEALALFESASRHVPEEHDFSILASYCRGLHFLKEDNCAEALLQFNVCGELPPNFGLEELRFHAGAGTAFDAKDYSRFLSLAEGWEANHPDSAMAVAQTASALACKYSATGDKSFLTKSLEKLKKAGELDRKELEENRFAERILFRLKSREVITLKEYERRFPEKQNWELEGK